MLYVAYGLPKSGSTFIAQMIERSMALAAGETQAAVRSRYLPVELQGRYQDLTPDIETTILDSMPPDVDLLVKTHARCTPKLRAMIQSGEVAACASFRDPRDVALSLMDVAERDRATGRDRPGFTAIRSLEDTLPIIRYGMQTLRDWVRIEGVLLLPFRLIVEDPYAVCRAVRDQLAMESGGSSV